jgi:hypothetical protein
MTIHLPRGEELKKALDDRGISTRGLAVSTSGQPMEAAMQERLLEVLRDENAEALTRYTRSLVRANWALAIASIALILTSLAQILLTIKKS